MLASRFAAFSAPTIVRTPLVPPPANTPAETALFTAATNLNTDDLTAALLNGASLDAINVTTKNNILHLAFESPLRNDSKKLRAFITFVFTRAKSAPNSGELINSLVNGVNNCGAPPLNLTLGLQGTDEIVFHVKQLLKYKANPNIDRAFNSRAGAEEDSFFIKLLTFGRGPRNTWELNIQLITAIFQSLCENDLQTSINDASTPLSIGPLRSLMAEYISTSPSIREFVNRVSGPGAHAPLYRAVRVPNPDERVVRLLLDAEANPEAEDRDILVTRVKIKEYIFRNHRTMHDRLFPPAAAIVATPAAVTT